jgi:AraC-like DNA-binding protein
MFTKELGKNYVDYLNEVRIEKARVPEGLQLQDI